DKAEEIVGVVLPGGGGLVRQDPFSNRAAESSSLLAAAKWTNGSQPGGKSRSKTAIICTDSQSRVETGIVRGALESVRHDFALLSLPPSGRKVKRFEPLTAEA